MTAYVTLSGFREDVYLPHLFRTTNAGTSWQDITGSLPEAPLNDVVVDPEITNQLFVAGDPGVYSTLLPDTNWQLMGTGMPMVPVLDLTLHNPTRSLLAGTFGRSMYRIEIGPNCFTQEDWQEAMAAWGLQTTIIDLLNIQLAFCP